MNVLGLEGTEVLLTFPQLASIHDMRSCVML